MNAAQLVQMEDRLQTKVKTWIRCYAPSEIMGVVGAFGGATMAAQLGANVMLIAAAGAWGELLAYYLPMIGREFAVQRRNQPLPQAVWRTLRNLL